MAFFLSFLFPSLSLTTEPLKSDLAFPTIFISLQVTILPWFFPDAVHLPPCPQIHFSKASFSFPKPPHGQDIQNTILEMVERYFSSHTFSTFLSFHYECNTNTSMETCKLKGEGALRISLHE